MADLFASLYKIVYPRYRCRRRSSLCISCSKLKYSTSIGFCLIWKWKCYFSLLNWLILCFLKITSVELTSVKNDSSISSVRPETATILGRSSLGKPLSCFVLSNDFSKTWPFAPPRPKLLIPTNPPLQGVLSVMTCKKNVVSYSSFRAVTRQRFQARLFDRKRSYSCGNFSIFYGLATRVLNGNFTLELQITKSCSTNAFSQKFSVAEYISFLCASGIRIRTLSKPPERYLNCNPPVCHVYNFNVVLALQGIFQLAKMRHQTRQVTVISVEINHTTRGR